MDFSKWSKPNEGWDAGNLEFAELQRNAKLIVRNSIPVILLAVGMLWGVKFLYDLLFTAVATAGYFVPHRAFGVIGSILTWGGWFLSLAVSWAVFSLYRPMQLQAFEGKSFVSGGGEALRLSREVMVKVIITAALFSLATALGSIFCVVGLLIPLFLFFQAPYLAATTELSPAECMRRSYELSKAYALPVGVAIAVSVVVTGVLTGCGTVVFATIGGLLMKLFPPAGVLVATLGADICAAISAFLVLVVSGTVFTTIQSVERGVPFADSSL